jgi:hypothetical protein
MSMADEQGISVWTQTCRACGREARIIVGVNPKTLKEHARVYTAATPHVRALLCDMGWSETGEDSWMMCPECL